MTRALAIWLCAVACGTPAAAQVCDVCDPEVEMSAAEAECFLERADDYLKDAEVAEPVLINLGECAAPAGPGVSDSG